MAASTMASGETTRPMAMDLSFTPMGISMKDLGSTIKRTDMALTNMQMEPPTLESGSRISNMAKALRNGPMVLNMKVITKMAGNTEMAVLPSPMDLRIQVNSEIMK